MIQQFTPDIPKNTGERVCEYIESGGWLTEHRFTRDFETLVEDFLGVKHCHAVTSGTMALYAALKACDVGQGHRVIVPALTMIATVNAVKMTGAEPIFVDVDETGCLDVNKVEIELVRTKNIQSVIYVSLNGRCGNIADLADLCDFAEVWLIEDACQSFGSRHEHKYLGTFGNIGCFSLSAYKTVGTGQGGLVVTDSDVLSDQIQKRKDHGRLIGGTDEHLFIGTNLKFTDVQAVIGIEQMYEIKDRIDRKKEVYYKYFKKLHLINKVKMMYTEISNTLPWMVDIYVEDRDELYKYLKDKDIQTRKMYPPVYRQGGYSIKEPLEKTEELSNQGLWLPSSPRLNCEEINTVCYEIYKYYA